MLHRIIIGKFFLYKVNDKIRTWNQLLVKTFCIKEIKHGFEIFSLMIRLYKLIPFLIFLLFLTFLSVFYHIFLKK